MPAQNLFRQAVAPLRDLAFNLWWSWNPAAQALYHEIDPELWKRVNHNPVKFLRLVSQRGAP